MQTNSSRRSDGKPAADKRPASGGKPVGNPRPGDKARREPDAPPPQADPSAAGTLPRQRSLTEEEPVPAPAKWKKILLRILAYTLLAVALLLGYLFLLLGEPDEDTQYEKQQTEETISMPMNALESPGESDVSALAQTFGQPVLALVGSELTMERSRVFDSAFGGGYARRVTLTYGFSDGQTLQVESIRPTAAIKLLKGEGYTLDADSLFSIGGVDAAWMDNGETICVFGQTGKAAYAVLCPKSHEAQLETLLKQTAMISPEAS